MRLHPGLVINQPLDGVCNLQLSPRRGLDGIYCLENARREEIYTNKGKIGLWFTRLLFQPDDLTIFQLGYTEPLRCRYMS